MDYSFAMFLALSISKLLQVCKICYQNCLTDLTSVVYGESCPLCLNNHCSSAPLPDPNLSFTTSASTAPFNQIIPLSITNIYHLGSLAFSINNRPGVAGAVLQTPL